MPPRIACRVAIVIAITMLCSDCSDAQRDDPQAIPDDYTLAGSAPVRITATSGDQSTTLSGELTLQFRYSKALAGEGWLELLGAGFALNGSPPVSGASAPAPAEGKAEEFGIALSGNQLPVRLNYDERTRTASGTLQVEAHYPLIDASHRHEPILGKGARVAAATGKTLGEEQDEIPVRRQAGTLKLEIVYAKPLEESLDSIGNSRRIRQLDAQVKVTGEFLELQGDTATVGGFSVNSSSEPLGVSAGNSGATQVMRSLCIQPVKVSAAGNDGGEPGRGWEYGLPAAEALWRKAGVVFDLKPWITIDDSDFRVVADDAELLQLMSRVKVDKCVEIFFIEQFEDASTAGGGLTDKGGTESARIVTSDIVADGPNDRAHLAHELGHVLNLGHPGAAAGHFNSSTNTLMCPSDLRADNPQRMSRDNADHISSPLLANTVRPRTTQVDCNTSADCQPCPN